MDMFDEARAIASTMKLCHLTQSELARQLGVSQSYVANKLRLLKFPKKMAEKITSAGISERHARSILRLFQIGSDSQGQAASEAAAEAILAAVIDRSLTVRECEAMVDAELMRRMPDSLGRSRAPALDRIAELRCAISSACDTLRSQGINARSRASYLGDDLYITVVVKNA